VRRRRLIARLVTTLRARVTLVSGPAGSGKTTCVAQWARALTTAVVWVTFDPTDDDFTRLRARFLAAWPDLAAPEDDAFVRALHQLDEDTVLVCDGVDVLSDPLAVAELDALCADAPAHLHIVLVGRAIPTLPALTRIRLTGDLEEITADHLVCRDDEAAALLDGVGITVTPEQRAGLLERTEGLVAAVALAGVLARGHDVARVLHGFNGATTELGQYLYAEVVSPLAVDVFGFMLATSVLDVLSPAACDEITGRSDSKVLLEELTSRNAMTQPVDDGETYRYHRLLREFLRSELSHTQPDRFRALHRSAATHFERHGDEDTALKHWVEAGDLDEAWSRFRRRALPRFFDGAVTSVAQWTALLPKPSEAIDVGQALDMALALVYMGDIDGADDWRQLADAEVLLTEADADAIGRRAYVHFLLDFARGDLLRAAQQSATARRLLGPSTWSWDDLRAPLALAELESLLGRTARARTTVEEFVARTGDGGVLDRLAIASVLAALALADGKLTDAHALATEAIEIAALLTDPEFWFTVQARYVRGVVMLERNQLDGARKELEHSSAVARSQGFVHAKLLPLLALTRLQHLSGDNEDARDSLAQARRLIRRRNAPPLAHRIEEAEALFALADHDLRRAEKQVELLREPSRTRLLARVQLEQGREVEARATLDRVTITSLRDEIDVLLLRTAVADDDESVDLVGRALTLAEPDGYVRIFVDEGPRIAPYVRRLVGSWPSSFAAEVAAAVVAEPDRAASSRDLAELSEREQEVWRFLATALSMQEIADALYVSRNTLKSHVRSIYRKLGVGTREAAVGRGHGRRTDVNGPA
jgi:LuxR family transcriptional regulator, maltose regulon positive regulatory protein